MAIYLLIGKFKIGEKLAATWRPPAELRGVPVTLAGSGDRSEREQSIICHQKAVKVITADKMN